MNDENFFIVSFFYQGHCVNCSFKTLGEATKFVEEKVPSVAWAILQPVQEKETCMVFGREYEVVLKRKVK